MSMSFPKVAFIKARWHADITDQAHAGFCVEMARLIPQAVVDTYDVPGAFEMPLLAQKLARSGQYDAIVAAAFVVDGGIYRHDFVSAAVVNGLMTVGLDTGVPCFSVSLTPHHFQPVEPMISFFRDHFAKKGAEAAAAVQQIWALDQQLAAKPAHRAA